LMVTLAAFRGEVASKGSDVAAGTISMVLVDGVLTERAGTHGEREKSPQ